MARNPVISTSQRDIAAVDLDRVLVRLEKRINFPEAESKLLRSSYERTKTSANLEYARSLLIRLEHDTLRNQPQARKAADKSSLSRQRSLLKRLTDRMHELEQASHDEEEFYGPEEGEPLLSSEDESISTQAQAQAQAPSSVHDILPTSPHPPSPPSTLRNRFSRPAPTSSTSPFTPTDANTDTAQRLQNADSETGEMTSALLSLARQLKASQTQFKSSLEADDEALRRATEGLDKNESGLEAAGKRMGMLKRMSEGKGLWGRLMLYAWIGGLWMAAILLVFVGPKLRF